MTPFRITTVASLSTGDSGSEYTEACVIAISCAAQTIVAISSNRTGTNVLIRGFLIIGIAYASEFADAMNATSTIGHDKSACGKDSRRISDPPV